MKKVTLKIDGMTCSACSNSLEKYLNKQEGIISANVNLVMASAFIEYDETKLKVKQLEDFIKKAGYKSLGEYDKVSDEKKSRHEKIKFIIFGILAVILLYISMGHMVGLPVPDILSMHAHPMVYAATLCVLTIAFLIYGFDIIKSGYKNLVHCSPNMDTLVAIGVLSSFAYSVYNMVLIFQGHTHYVENLYFESAAIVIFFIKLGRYIDGVNTDKTKGAIKQLVQITPSSATIKKNGVETKVTIDEIQVGDTVVSHAGDKISVDGKITLGKAHLDESFITGESKPVSKDVGDNVIAGSINYDGYLEYTAEKIGKNSTISQIVNLVIEATNTKAPIARIADKVSGYFVPFVMVLALLTFIVYAALGQGTNVAINAFVTILVVACPCALGLATPLALVVSEGKCAKKGILVKKSEVLENASKINTVVFDKTGTLTYGMLKVNVIHNYSKLPDKILMQIVCSLEKKSNHPIGQAFVQYAWDNNLMAKEVTDFENMSGYGIKGKIDGSEIMLGNARLLKEKNIKNKYQKEENKLSQKGNSIIYVVVEGKICGLIGVNDIIRENVKDVICELKNRHIETIMLTGDNEKTANNIAKEIGITNVIANVLPTDKAKVISNLKRQRKHVLMCGDGINDSPALASADIGVSVHSGTDIAIDSADVILMKNDLNKIVDLIKISKKTVRIIKQNLFWAFFYNILMIPIAMGVFSGFGLSINPMIAGFAMMISSLMVVLNSLRLAK